MMDALMCFINGVVVKWPNDPKLSDGGGWRGLCRWAERWRRSAAQAVTAVAVRCSAWLGASLELLAASGNNSVILAVMTNPEPDDVRAVLDGGSAIMDADTNRPHPANLLEVEGRMP